MTIDATDRAIIATTQTGLPLMPRPYDEVARRLDLDAGTVEARIKAMQAKGIIRRIGAVPNHYKLGWQANGMSVWDVDDGAIDELGPKIGALEFVSHCYKRPRHGRIWPYNLFAMVHGRGREEVREKISRIEDILGASCRAHDVLYSRRILKKTGLRLKT